MSSLKLLHSGGNGVIISAPSSNPASNITFTVPNADGSANQVIKTDASGNLSFIEKGKILQVKSSANGESSNTGFPSYVSQNINNGGATIGPSLTINRKSANSYFLISVSALVGRAATSGWGYMGYQLTLAGGTTHDIYARLSDNANSIRCTVQFVQSASGSVNDSVVVQGYYVNSVAHNDDVRQATINIMEFQP